MPQRSTQVLSFVAVLSLLVLCTACDGTAPGAVSGRAAGSDVAAEPFGDRVAPGTLPEALRPAFQQPGTWVFDESAGLTCRDGSTTGLGVRLQEDEVPSRRGGPFNLDNYSDNLLIFLEGGGACFNFPTCSQNRPSFSREEFFSDAFIGGYSGIFDDTRPENPVADWNFVYVPYCTGDEHVGSTADGTVRPLDIDFDGRPELPGLQNQQFVGYDNVGRTLEYVARYLGTDYDRVLLTGSSAGGVGALGNYTQVAAGFPDSETILLNDSGPVFYDDAILPVSLQEVWRETWDLSAALPPGAGGEVDVLEAIYGDVATSSPDASLGLISYEQDFTIRFFYSFGTAMTDPTCAQALYGGLLSDPPRRSACIGATAYEKALYDLRDALPGPWRTFYTSVPDARLHTFLRDDRFYRAAAGGQSLGAWIDDLIKGAAQDRGRRD